MRGFASVVMVGALVAGGARRVGKVAVSLARPRPRPAMARCRPAPRRRRVPTRRATSAASVLPDRTRIPRRPTRWAAATSARRSSPTIANAERGSRAGRGPRASPRAPGGRRPATACRGSCARRPVANSSPTTNAAGVERLALRASATTGCDASPSSVGAAADRAGRRRRGSGTTGRRRASPMTTAATRPGGRGVGLVGGQQSLAVELAQRVVGGEHEQRPARVTAPRCRRPRPRRR